MAIDSEKIQVELELCFVSKWKQIVKYDGYIICPFCIDSMYGKYIFESPCKHNICYDCAMTMYDSCKKISCPVCSNVKVMPNNTLSMSSDNSSDSFYNGSYFFE